jgi:hypothetical protein
MAAFKVFPYWPDFPKGGAETTVEYQEKAQKIPRPHSTSAAWQTPDSLSVGF